MLSNDELEQKLANVEGVEFVKVGGDGYHYHLTIVSEIFQNKSKVARQQWVYALLKQHIISGSLHALSMQTLTKEEWETQHG
jgi:acid stress-induced BolA-like protein IbaG/YrbA